jgi:P-type conjugative transfer ATPase TrbB
VSDALTAQIEFNERAARKLTSELGPEIVQALGDDDVIDIFVTPADASGTSELWIDRQSSGMASTGTRLSSKQIENVICTVATLLNTVATRTQPILEGELPYFDCRFEGLLPPVVTSPIFCIRRPSSTIYPLESFFPDAASAAWLRRAVQQRWNILVSGATGSGKTALVNSLLLEAADDRLVVLEDTREIRTRELRNATALRTSAEVDMSALLRATLRVRPDRIIVGEVRGREALDLLKAWNTGHPGGVGTVHADSAPAALERLDQLCQEAEVPSQAPLIGRAIGCVVQLERQSDRRRVVEQLEVRGFDRERREYRTRSIPISVSDTTVASDSEPEENLS